MRNEEQKCRNREYTAEYQRELRKIAFRVLGDRCAACGFDDPVALQVDHIDGNGRAERRKDNFNTYAVYRRIRDGETEGYQILCANCNIIKHATVAQ